MTEYWSDEMPTFMVRAVDDSGGMMTGGAAHVGSCGAAMASRSCTNCRAVIRSVPGSKMSRIDESCYTDFERMTSRLGTQLS